MSVQVEGVTKVYGSQKAVDNIRFEARKGEVVGFLGPNGAGKTTTMKILTGFIPQTSGVARVCGYDVETDSMEARRHIGYLPEHNPLYKEAYVKEYLYFVAGLHKVADKKKRVAEMIERTGLGTEQNKQIGQLSKGYRQRVGLAQAMIHDPEVLILDEPTSGLDPNQLVEIRSLIKDLGKEKTVLFSTHIMQEVQALCDRVLIINRGKIVADDPIEVLRTKLSGGTGITVAFLEPTDKKALEKIPNVVRATLTEKKEWLLTINGDKDARPDVFRFAVANGLTLLEMRQDKVSVESVFHELTR